MQWGKTQFTSPHAAQNDFVGEVKISVQAHESWEATLT